MSVTRDPKLLQAAAEQHAQESWKRLVVEARRRDVQLLRTDSADGPQKFVSVRRGRELQLHEDEPSLRLYLRGCH